MKHQSWPKKRPKINKHGPSVGWFLRIKLLVSRASSPYVNDMDIFRFETSSPQTNYVLMLRTGTSLARHKQTRSEWTKPLTWFNKNHWSVLRSFGEININMNTHVPKHTFKIAARHFTMCVCVHMWNQGCRRQRLQVNHLFFSAVCFCGTTKNPKKHVNIASMLFRESGYQKAC